jgi:hypothetical protein
MAGNVITRASTRQRLATKDTARHGRNQNMPRRVPRDTVTLMTLTRASPRKTNLSAFVSRRRSATEVTKITEESETVRLDGQRRLAPDEQAVEFAVLCDTNAPNIVFLHNRRVSVTRRYRFSNTARLLVAASPRCVLGVLSVARSSWCSSWPTIFARCLTATNTTRAGIPSGPSRAMRARCPSRRRSRRHRRSAQRLTPAQAGSDASRPMNGASR